MHQAFKYLTQSQAHNRQTDNVSHRFYHYYYYYYYLIRPIINKLK